MERGLKRDKATLLSRVEELEAAQHSADQQQEAEEAARQAEAEEAARRATEVNRLVEEAALRHWQELEATWTEVQPQQAHHTSLTHTHQVCYSHQTLFLQYVHNISLHIIGLQVLCIITNVHKCPQTILHSNNI
mgnify:CR=1 FL=1